MQGVEAAPEPQPERRPPEAEQGSEQKEALPQMWLRREEPIAVNGSTTIEMPESPSPSPNPKPSTRLSSGKAGN